MSTPKQKKVKAWYVGLKLKVKYQHFSGEGFDYRARIFPTRKLAEAAFADRDGKPSETADIIPCTITFKV